MLDSVSRTMNQQYLDEIETKEGEDEMGLTSKAGWKLVEPRASLDSEHLSSCDGSETEDANRVATGATSLKVFRSFMRRYPDGTLDASLLVSPECYNTWLVSRKQGTKHPEKVFQRSLSGHITGLDGRTPFTAEEETAVLKVVRKKERWPCFENSSTRFGTLGFRAYGFHEKLSIAGEGARVTTNLKAQMYKDQAVRQQGVDSAPSSAAVSPTSSSSRVTRSKRQKRLSPVTTSSGEASELDTVTPVLPSPQQWAPQEYGCFELSDMLFPSLSYSQSPLTHPISTAAPLSSNTRVTTMMAMSDQIQFDEPPVFDIDIGIQHLFTAVAFTPRGMNDDYAGFMMPNAGASTTTINGDGIPGFYIPPAPGTKDAE